MIGAALAVLTVTIAFWFVWPGRTPTVEPLPVSDFAACSFETLPERVPIGDEFPIAAGTGTYAEIRITAADAIPASLDGAAVQPFARWPVSLWIYPLGKQMIDGYCAGTRRYPDPKGKQPEAYLSKGGHYWGYQETGYTGLLPRPANHPTDPNTIVCWTYVSTMPDKTGDLLYEISVYPTATPGVKSRPRYGKREILKRGVVRVAPKSGSEAAGSD